MSSGFPCHYKNLFSSFWFSLLSLPLFAAQLFAQQQIAPQQDKDNFTPSNESVTPEYVIEKTRKTLVDNGREVLLQNIAIEVKGLSNKAILRNRLGVKEGQKFVDLTELRTVLDIGFDKLRGTGYFKKNGIFYRLLRANDAEIQRISLEAKFQNAWTLYPIVYPYYSTANGYGLRGRLRWDNFLGLLGNVTFRLNVTEVRGGNYGPDLSGGIGSSTIKIMPNFGISGTLNFERDAQKNGANWGLGAKIGGSLNIRALEAAGISMSYAISHSSSATFAYTAAENTTKKDPYFSTGFSHSFSLDKTQTTWGGVFRQGYSMSLGNSYSFDSDTTLHSLQTLALEDIALDLSLKLSRAYFDVINFKGRFGVAKSFDFSDGKYNDAGLNYDVSDYNRGKRAGNATGKFIAFLNMDMALLVFSDSVLGSVLLEPFLDATWVHDAKGFILENTSLGSGFDLIWVFRSLKLRFTFGFDLRKPESYTIAITTGFYF